MDLELLAILITGILNLLATLRQSRCTDIHSTCCYGLLSVGLERELEDKQEDKQKDKPENENTNELI